MPQVGDLLTRGGQLVQSEPAQLDDNEEDLMPKYLIEASYTAEGVKGLMASGAKARRDAARQAAKSVGASVDGFYFAFGDSDAYLIVDAPNNEAVAAISLAVNSTGLVTTRTVVLMSPKEVDKAIGKSVEYTPPGG